MYGKTRKAATFARHFRATLGTTPYQWLLQQRIVLAQRLLETTNETIERVATCCGFSSAATLRLHFQRLLHTSPQVYRHAFHRENRGERPSDMNGHADLNLLAYKDQWVMQRDSGKQDG